MATTFGDLVTRAKGRVDMANSQFVTADDWLEFVRDGYRALYNFLGRKFEDYFVTVSSVQAIGTDGTLDVPADFGVLIAMDTGAVGNWSEVSSVAINRRNSSFSRILGIQVPMNQDFCYRLLGRKLYFFPDASAAGKSVRIWYQPLPQNVALNDSLPIDMERWSRAIVLDAGRMALKKEESDASGLESELMEIMNAINLEAETRDAQRVDNVVDVQSGGVRVEDYY